MVPSIRVEFITSHWLISRLIGLKEEKKTLAFALIGLQLTFFMSKVPKIVILILVRTIIVYDVLSAFNKI